MTSLTVLLPPIHPTFMRRIQNQNHIRSWSYQRHKDTKFIPRSVTKDFPLDLALHKIEFFKQLNLPSVDICFRFYFASFSSLLFNFFLRSFAASLRFYFCETRSERECCSVYGQRFGPPTDVTDQLNYLSRTLPTTQIPPYRGHRHMKRLLIQKSDL